MYKLTCTDIGSWRVALSGKTQSKWVHYFTAIEFAKEFAEKELESSVAWVSDKRGIYYRNRKDAYTIDKVKITK